MNIYDLRKHKIKHINIEFYIIIQYNNTNVIVGIMLYLFVKQ